MASPQPNPDPTQPPIVNSPPPGAPQTADKAKIAASLFAVIVAVAGSLRDYYAGGNDFSSDGLITWILTAILGAGVVGYGTYQTRNKPL